MNVNINYGMSLTVKLSNNLRYNPLTFYTTASQILQEYYNTKKIRAIYRRVYFRALFIVQFNLKHPVN